MTATFASAIIISNPEANSESNQPPTIHMISFREQLQEVLYGKYIFTIQQQQQSPLFCSNMFAYNLCFISKYIFTVYI